jgi:undecaprenyl diphosphate synthase
MNMIQMLRRAVRLIKPAGGAKDAGALPQELPRHVAFIMDGNGRWAQKRGLPRTAGHTAGMETLIDMVRACDDWGIEAVSVYAFSTENWGRPGDEINALMGLLLRYFASQIDELHQKNVRVQVMGDLDRLPEIQRSVVLEAVARTSANSGLLFNIGLNYGGRAELVRAARKLIEQGVPAEAVDEAALEARLYTAGQPDVDLLIRTSGEMRVSGFMPWQSAYAEIIFNPVLWPDYTRDVFRRDLAQFARRERRFGKV